MCMGTFAEYLKQLFSFGRERTGVTFFSNQSEKRSAFGFAFLSLCRDFRLAAFFGKKIRIPAPNTGNADFPDRISRRRQIEQPNPERSFGCFRAKLEKRRQTGRSFCCDEKRQNYKGPARSRNKIRLGNLCMGFFAEFATKQPLFRCGRNDSFASDKSRNY